MGKARSEPFGISIPSILALIGPVARRLVRWWLLWLVFVLVMWAVLPGVQRGAQRLQDALPTASSDSVPEGDVDTRSPWCRATAESSAAAPDDDLIRRDIEIDLRKGAATAAMSAEFAACSTRLGQAIETMARQGVADAAVQQQVRESVFGYINLGGEQRYAPLQMIAGDGAPSAVLRSSLTLGQPASPTAAATRSVVVSPSTWTARTTHVRIRFDAGAGAWSSIAAPLRQTDDTIEWELKGTDAFVNVVFQLPVAQTGGTAERRGSAASAPLLIRLLAGDVGGLRSLWLGITLALPFVLLWSWASRVDPSTRHDLRDPLVAAVRDGCAVALSLIAALALLELSESVLSDIEWLPGRYQFHNLAWTASICKSALIATALIAFGTWAAPLQRTASSLPLALVGLALAIGGWVLDPSNLAHFTGRLQDAGIFSTAGMVGLLIGLFGAWLVAGALTVEGFRWALVLRGACVLVGATLGVAWLEYAEVSRLHLPVVAPLFALPFGWAFVSVSRAWLPGRPRLPIWTMLLGALAAAALALPPDYERHWSQAWLIGSTAWALVRWWQLPALILLIAWLAREPRPDGLASSGHVEAAAVFLFVLFYWNAQLSFLPLVVQAAAGLAVLRWGVFATRPLSVPTRRHRLLSKTIDDLRDFNALIRTRQSLAKALNDKLVKGDLDAQGWLDRKDRDDRILSRRAGPAERGRIRAMLALNIGPRGNAWQRGCTGALVTTVLALPWIATFLTHTSFRTGNPTNAATLSQLGIVAFDLLRWPALGFFFLYFYPVVRGINGIQKGMTLAACVIVPSAAATLISTATSHGPWTVFALWSLQVFICCMCVGVGLGDIGALRKVGKGPRALIEIYDLGTLAAWFTSIALAVGAAATTAIASGAGAALTVGFKMLIPEAPPVLPHP